MMEMEQTTSTKDFLVRIYHRYTYLYNLHGKQGRKMKGRGRGVQRVYWLGLQKNKITAEEYKENIKNREEQDGLNYSCPDPWSCKMFV